MARTLIQGGTVVTAVDTYAADVAIVDGKIAAHLRAGRGARRARGTRPSTRSGKYVLPGGIDAHTHLDMPFGGTSSSDDFETRHARRGPRRHDVHRRLRHPDQGRGRCARGSTPGTRKAEGKAAVDYALPHDPDRRERRHGRRDAAAASTRASRRFKMFMAYPGVFLVDDGQIFRAMQRAGEIGALICMHAENGIPIDVLVQQALAKGHTAPDLPRAHAPADRRGRGDAPRDLPRRDGRRARLHRAPLAPRARSSRWSQARDRGLPAFAETCPQYLFLSQDDLARPGFEGAKYVCTPPLRPREMQEDLWRGLRTHDLQVVSTDHCPFCMKGQKELGKDSFAKIPNGMPGVETRMYLLWDGGVRTGRISMNRFVEITSTAPAKIFGLYPRKGTIAVGADADLVVWDGEKKHTLSDEDAAHARRLHALRGPRGHRRADARALARQGRRRERQVPRQEGRRALRQEGPLRALGTCSGARPGHPPPILGFPPAGAGGR